MISAIPSHVLNTTDANNYSAGATGKWPCEDTMIKGSGPLAHLGDCEMSPNGSNPRRVGGNAPKKFYQSVFALALSTLRFKKISRVEAQGRENMSAADNLEIELSQKGSESVDLLLAFVKTNGPKWIWLCVCRRNSILSLNFRAAACRF